MHPPEQLNTPTPENGSPVVVPWLHYPELFATVATTQKGDDKIRSDSLFIGNHAELELAIREATRDGTQQLDPDTATRLWSVHFMAPEAYTAQLVPVAGTVSPETGLTLSEYISKTWADLTYHEPQDKGSLLGTKFPHLKCGRRYNEGYYWDLADGIEGLCIEAFEYGDLEKQALVMGVLKNCRNLIREHGFIPNGMRRYYLTRSQPPKFVQMVKRVAQYDPTVVEEFLPEIVKEYEWWMKGAPDIDPEKGVRASDHVVMMPDGELLNRYWDTDDAPRPEGYNKDIETAVGLNETEARQLYRNLRIIAASGRDFTAEYLEDIQKLETACADRCIPLDLNALLAEAELFIAEAHDRAGRSVPANEFHTKFERRAAAINKYQWNGDEQTGYYSVYRFDDHSFTSGAPTGFASMTMAYPVARGVAPPERAACVSNKLVRELLGRGGFVGSLARSSQQWDWKNGWAPDQNEGVEALDRTAALTGDSRWAAWGNIARSRWMNRHAVIYKALGKIVEKCNVVGPDPFDVQDGEYPLQDGFLWTNGILRKFMHHMAKIQLPADVAAILTRKARTPLVIGGPVQPSALPTT